MIKLLSFLIILQCSVVASATPFHITLNGSFPGAEGREIRLMEYGDLVSFREVEIASAIIDQDAGFTFTFSRFNPLYVFFRIDHNRLGIYVEPGNEYVIDFDPVDFDLLNDRINPYLNPWYFDYKISKPENSLNENIENLDDVLYEFLEENFRTIQRMRDMSIFLPIKHKTDSLFGHIENPYFKDYYRYKYGYYLQVSNLRRFTDLVREYIYNQPVLYHNTQYMNLFNTLFDTYIFAGSRSITISDLRHTVNNLNSSNALMDSLGKDTILHNEVIRELVMLKGLQDMHGNPDYRQSNVKDILTYVMHNSKFPQHRDIARNILHEKQYLMEGTAAPKFEIVDIRGDTLRVPEDFKGKYLYLSFWASWCESCQLEFIALNEVFGRFKDDIAVLSISTDRHLPTYLTSINQNPSSWLNAHFNRDFRLLDSYQIRSLPTYVLIDREGNIVNFPARRPSEDLVTLIEWLLHQERRSVIPR